MVNYSMIKEVLSDILDAMHAKYLIDFVDVGAGIAFRATINGITYKEKIFSYKATDTTVRAYLFRVLDGVANL